MKRLLALVLAASVAGCTASASANITIGHPGVPKVDNRVVERLVCEGNIAAAQALLEKKGFDDATVIERIVDARVKCENR